jgi:hypothetical protein
MKMLRLNALFLLAAMSFFILSCSDDDDKDLQDQAAGTYNYKTKAYYLNGTSLLYLNEPDLDDSGTIIFTKTTTGFEMKEGGDLVFTASKLASATNGFTFDIESQTVKIDGGGDFTIDGYDGVTLGTVKYNGLYDKSKKQMTAYFKTQILFEDQNGNQFTGTLVIEFVGDKV